MNKVILLCAFFGMLVLSLEAAPQPKSSSMEHIKRGWLDYKEAYTKLCFK
jgi:hypothetical protein